MTSSPPPTLMPASSSCSISRSTETFSTFAKSATVTSAICVPTLVPLCLLLLLEPVRARCHDELGGTLCIETRDRLEIVDSLFGEVLARHDPTAGQLQCELAI